MGTLKERELVILQGLNMSENFFPDGREFVFTSSKDGRHGIYIGDATSMKGETSSHLHGSMCHRPCHPTAGRSSSPRTVPAAPRFTAPTGTAR
ncbi:MAG: hypothetical protein MZV64_71320 [Ignavibacteriales bacterium]|nr:hypothetical protein [Ignavibacteriales bacterium]